MKLKTLLLGSAAAMIAFTGARAADAVVAEPEPVDYVRVCDMYGAGFFYIPGTETCLRIDGYVEVQYEYTAWDSTARALGYPASGRGSDGEASYTGRVNFDARSETDYGTLRSYIRVESQGGNNTGTADAFMRDVYIELGGLAMGYRSNDVSVSGHRRVLTIVDDASFQRDWFVSYTYASNGFTGIVGVVTDSGEVIRDNLGVIQDIGGVAADSGRSIDPYLSLAYAGSIFSVRATVGYDSSAEETGYGINALVTPVDGLGIWAWYEGQSGYNGFTAADHHYGVGASYAVTDTLAIAVGYSFRDEPKSPTVAGTDDIQSIRAGLLWNIAPGLDMHAEYGHTEYDHTAVGVGDAEQDEFRVRFKRSF